MTINFFRQSGFFVVLCLVQALVLNRIHLFGCATPLVYILMIMTMRRNYPKWGILLWSFSLGLVIDTFSNTPGVAAASLTLVGVIQPYFLELFLQRDAADDFLPSVRTMGMGRFSFFSFILVWVYCIVFFTLETFSFFNWSQWLLQIGGSTLITWILVVTIDSVRKK